MDEKEINISIPADMGLTEQQAQSLVDVGFIARQTYDAIWDLVRPDPEAWDYPAQVTRYVAYVVKERDQLKADLAAARAEVERLALVLLQVAGASEWQLAGYTVDDYRAFLKQYDTTESDAS